MGWKSTIYIDREEAIELIAKATFTGKFLTNKELENMVERIGYGDNTELKYYGHNFIVVDDMAEIDINDQR